MHPAADDRLPLPEEPPTSRVRTASTIAGAAAISAGAPAVAVTGSAAIGALTAALILACVALAALMI